MTARLVADGPLALAVHLADVRLLDGRHADRPVYTAEWTDPRSGTSSPVVVKCFRGDDATGRARSLDHIGRLVWASTAGAARPTPVIPRPVAVGDLGTDAAVVMEAIGGSAIGARGDLGRSVALAAASAELLADLHAASPTASGGGERWPGVPRRPAARIVRSSLRKLAELPPEIASAARPLLDRLRADEPSIRARGERLEVSHGDASPRNVFATPDGLRLIDLDRVHLAGAGRDVAYWLAWSLATVWTGAPSRTPTDDLTTDDLTTDHLTIDHLTAGVLGHYLRRRAGLSDGAAVVEEVCADLPFHLAAAFVRIVHGWSSLRADREMQQRVLHRAAEAVSDAPACIRAARRDVSDRCGAGDPGANMPPCGHDDRREEIRP